MDHTIKRLGNADLEIMLVLWGADHALTSNEVRTQLKSKRDWKLSTLMTAMEKLAKQGFIYVDRTTRTNYYNAAIGGNEYKLSESKSLLEKLYGSSLKNLVANFYQEDALSAADLTELQSFIEKLKEEKESVPL